MHIQHILTAARSFFRRTPVSETDAAQGKKKHYYVPALDGLRFVAFLIVFHREMPIIQNDTIREIYTRFHITGWVGVDLFFAISAFLITELLLREFDKRGVISLTQFYIRRLLRIWPLYFLILVLVFLILPAFFHISFLPGFDSPAYARMLHDLPPLSVFMGNIAIMFRGFPEVGQLGILWTLAMEEQFYIVWPFIIIFLIGRTKRTQYIVLVTLLLLPMLMRVFFYIGDAQWNMIYVNPLTRFDTFVAGGLVAFIARDLVRLSISAKWVAAVSGITALATGAILFSNVAFRQIDNTPPMIWMYSLLAICCASSVMYILHSKGLIVKILGLRPIAWLGKISYGLYIFQFFGIYFANSVVGFTPDVRGWFIFTVVSIAITVLIAAASYYIYEMPFLKLKKRFTVIANR